MTIRYSHRKVPSDAAIERLIVGSGLKRWTVESCEPTWFYDDKHRLFYVSILTLQQAGYLVDATDRYDFKALMCVGKQNACLVLRALEQTELWHFAVCPQSLLWQCLCESTQPQDCDFYADQLKRLYHQRWEIWTAEDRLRAAWESVQCR